MVGKMGTRGRERYKGREGVGGRQGQQQQKQTHVKVWVKGKGGGWIGVRFF
jgi:hypothetical protein